MPIRRRGSAASREMGSHVLVQSTQRQAGSGLRQETGFLSWKEPRKVMLSLAPLAFSRKGPSSSLWWADAPFHPGRPRRTHSLRDPCTEGTRPGSRKAGFHFRLKSLDFPDKHKAQVSASKGRDPTHSCTLLRRQSPSCETEPLHSATSETRLPFPRPGRATEHYLGPKSKHPAHPVPPSQGVRRAAMPTPARPGWTQGQTG